MGPWERVSQERNSLQEVHGMNAQIASVLSTLRPSLHDLFRDGMNEGFNIINANTPLLIAQEYHSGFIEEDCTEEAAVIFAANCEEVSRDFTPGEFLCKRINVRNDRDEAWEAYEGGVRFGARLAYWAVYHLGLSVCDVRAML